MRWAWTALGWLGLCVSAACGGTPTAEDSRPAFCSPDGGDVDVPIGEVMDPSEGDGTLTLFVDNQESEGDRANIVVEIDGTVQIDADFCVGTQHNEIRYVVMLSRSEHIVTAAADSGATATVTIDLTTDQWLTLSHWLEPAPRLVVALEEDPPEFG